MPPQGYSQTRLYLFGSFRLERDGQAIHLATRKVESLLAFLALFPEPHPREQLAALFWGDNPDILARGSLRKALTLLREHLGDAILLADRETVQLNSKCPIWIDAREFQQSANADPQSAIALYTGALLTDFYDDWVLSERERYLALHVETLLRLAQRMRAQSEYARAIEFAQKVLASDRPNERAHQHLMFCYLALGNRNAALKQYEECQRALQGELAVEPAPETKALYLWIKQTPSEVPAFEARITNLPIPLTSFIGRKSAMAQVKQRIEQNRLVTLTGAGGSGKTRLAIQVTTDLIDGFKDGVWWVELAALTDKALVLPQVSKALGIQEIPNQSPDETLTNWLQSRQLLLVLDNCEHLIAACAQLVERLLSACRDLKILATSREALGIAGEMACRVESLTVPDPQTLSLAELLLSFEGIRLFIDRASAIQPGFALTEQNAVAVAQICRRLDGIPLAIELAAVRASTLSVEQIGARLDDRFNLLTRSSRTALPRQQTLRATIDWSYDLLSEQERPLFCRLAVFAGGWTLEATESVCAIDGLEQVQVFDTLSRLVDKSLVVVEVQFGAARYRMLDTIRQYARDKLLGLGESDRLRDRHLDYFLALTEKAEHHLFGKDREEWLDRLEEEHDNLRAALDWALASGHAEFGLRLAAALWWFWEMRGYIGEGQAHLTAVLGLAEGMGDTSARARALHAAGRLAQRQGDLVPARQLLEQSRAMGRTLGDKWTQMVSLHNLGNVLNDERGEIAIERLLHEESLNLARELGNDWGITWALMGLGHVAIRESDYTAARSYFEDSLKIRRRLGDKWGIARSLNELGEVAQREGDYASAQKFYEESLTIHRELGHKSHEPRVLFNLGSTALSQNDYGRAQALFVQCLRLSREQGRKTWMIGCLGGLAQVAAALGQVEKAARLFGAADAQGEARGRLLHPADREEPAHYLAAVRAQLGEAPFDAAWTEGRVMTLDQAVACAFGTEGEG